MAKHFIAHRVNSLEELKKTPVDYGVEIDIRPYANELVLEHDPYVKGEALEPYLAQYQHGTLILNIKAEGVEFRVLDLLKKYQIENYFFLDCSFPMINKLANQNEKRIALRYSEYEGLDTLRQMAGRVDWVWVDCFTHLPLRADSFQQIKKLGYRLCLVSPELQGQPEKIAPYKQQLIDEKIVFDAICTKSYTVPQWASQ